jgi:MFS transporter, DHA2 family, multidrug resistance protein
VNNPVYVHALAAIQSTLHVSFVRAEAFFETQMTSQAAMLGLNDVFWLSAVTFVMIIPLIWVTKPAKGVAKGPGAGAH